MKKSPISQIAQQFVTDVQYSMPSGVLTIYKQTIAGSLGSKNCIQLNGVSAVQNQLCLPLLLPSCAAQTGPCIQGNDPACPLCNSPQGNLTIYGAVSLVGSASSPPIAFTNTWAGLVGTVWQDGGAVSFPCYTPSVNPTAPPAPIYNYLSSVTLLYSSTPLAGVGVPNSSFSSYSFKTSPSGQFYLYYAPGQILVYPTLNSFGNYVPVTSPVSFGRNLPPANAIPNPVPVLVLTGTYNGTCIPTSGFAGIDSRASVVFAPPVANSNPNVFGPPPTNPQNIIQIEPTIGGSQGVHLLMGWGNDEGTVIPYQTDYLASFIRSEAFFGNTITPITPQLYPQPWAVKVPQQLLVTISGLVSGPRCTFPCRDCESLNSTWLLTYMDNSAVRAANPSIPLSFWWQSTPITFCNLPPRPIYLQPSVGANGISFSQGSGYWNLILPDGSVYQLAQNNLFPMTLGFAWPGQNSASALIGESNPKWVGNQTYPEQSLSNCLCLGQPLSVTIQAA